MFGGLRGVSPATQCARRASSMSPKAGGQHHYSNPARRSASALRLQRQLFRGPGERDVVLHAAQLLQ